MNLDFLTGKVERWSAIVQARMGSTRLPNKSLLELGGKPLVEHVVDRLALCKPGKIILAIPDTDENYPLEEWAKKKQIECVRGPENDVLARFVLAAEKCPSDILARATADNPFIDPEIISKTVGCLTQATSVDDPESKVELLNTDYAVMDGSPLGTTVEVFTRETLEWLDLIARTNEEREHVTLAVWNHPDEFNIQVIPAPQYLRHENLRLTVDTDRDMALVRHLYKALAGDLRTITLREIIKYVKHNPIVLRMNSNVEQRLGSFIAERHQKSIKNCAVEN